MKSIRRTSIHQSASKKPIIRSRQGGGRDAAVALRLGGCLACKAASRATGGSGGSGGRGSAARCRRGSDAARRGGHSCWRWVFMAGQSRVGMGRVGPCARLTTAGAWAWAKKDRCEVSAQGVSALGAGGPAVHFDFRPLLGRYVAPLVLPQALGQPACDGRRQRGLKLGHAQRAAGDPGRFEGRLHTVILYSTNHFVKPVRTL